MKIKFSFVASICLVSLICACSDDKDDDNSSQTTKIVENTMELCSDGVDNDNNDLIDCKDSGCSGFVFCQSIDPNKENSPETCADGIDNDNNGIKDCEEAYCKNFTMCKAAEAENTDIKCKDGLDNDKDGLIDCNDSDCAEFCSSPSDEKVENTSALCHDEKDNDEDGLTDCDDSDCVAFCNTESENTPELCSDGVDNDNDGLADCQDSDCQSLEICTSVVSGVKENTRELCSDNIDNDNNGTADCDDKNCRALEICTSGGKSGEDDVAVCADGMDNDGDGLKDCDDPECRYFDICNGKTDDDEDVCPDDPYKYLDDGCECGQTMINGECYINIDTPEGFSQLANSNKKYIVKRPIDFGDTVQAPITGFSGVLDGDHMRITGFFTQNAVNSIVHNECGFFGTTSGSPVFKNINIAITLNCTDTNYDNLVVGALVSMTQGSIQNVMGESKVMLKSIMKAEESHNGSKFFVIVGGIVGHHSKGAIENIEVVGNTSAQIEWQFKNNTEINDHSINVGGVVGQSSKATLGNVNAPSTVTLDYKFTNSPKDINCFVGGIAGYADSMDMCSNIGGSILVRHDNKSNLNYNHYIGGLVGQVHSVKDSVFTGSVMSNGAAGMQNASAQTSSLSAYAGTNIGGIAGVLKSNITNTDEKVSINGCYVDADMTLIVGPGMHAGGLLGRMGDPMTEDSEDEYYIVNSYANIDLILNNPDENYTRNQFYWGGAASEAAQNGYVLNSHLRTNYKLDDFNLDLDNIDLFLGGIVSKNDLGKDVYGGHLIDNFVSGGPVVAETSDNLDKFRSHMAATYGYYIYETYWEGDVYGTNIQTATQSTKQDGSAKPYSYNGSNIAVLSDNNTVVGLLRKNSGHDGGVQSAYLPRGIQYSDWKQITDEDGHQVPVPDSFLY